MIVSISLALSFTNAKQVFDIILMFGAGSGLIFLLRWFWWRINAWSEITAMVVSGIVSIILTFTPIGTYLFGAEGIFESYFTFPFVVLVTTVSWLAVTFLTSPEDDETLFSFYEKIQPSGKGWNKVIKKAGKQNVTLKTDQKPSNLSEGILAMAIGTLMVYFILFATGYWLYGIYTSAFVLTILAVIAMFALVKIWKNVRSNVL